MTLYNRVLLEQAESPKQLSKSTHLLILKRVRAGYDNTTVLPADSPPTVRPEASEGDPAADTDIPYHLQNPEGTINQWKPVYSPVCHSRVSTTYRHIILKGSVFPRGRSILSPPMWRSPMSGLAQAFLQRLMSPMQAEEPASQETSVPPLRRAG